MLAFDLAYFLSGEQSDQAAIADGVIAPGEHVPNDYYIANNNPTLPDLAVAASTRIVVVDRANCCNAVSGDLFAFATAMHDQAKHGQYLSTPPYWITVRGGVTVRIEEQYLPQPARCRGPTPPPPGRGRGT